MVETAELARPIYAVDGVLDNAGWAQVEQARRLDCNNAEKFRVTVISRNADGSQQVLGDMFDC